MAERTLLDRVRRRWRRDVREPFDHRVQAPIRARFNARRTYRPIFVGGASGSGTSLMAMSLGSRFDCAGVIYETNFQVARDSMLYVPDIDEFESVAAYRDHMTPTPDWSVEQGRRDLFDCYRRYCWGPSDVVVDKGPDINLLRAQYLLQCFPDGHLVLIFRDPVANVEGLRRKWRTFGDEPLSATIGFWSDIHRAFLRAASARPDRALVLEYEALVEDPDRTLAVVGDRIGLEPPRRERRLFYSPNVEGMGIRNVRANTVGYVTDANHRARERLAPAEVEEIEFALADLERELRSWPGAVTRESLRLAAAG